ncbi:unnamed protein product [Mytilus coruscus]|uniref:Cell wall hydrolase SleB domain-containing protein n=1 Tax=Mytilus coruscus TaxID=42192 RepID=A0A6J8B931_MYTCO|nr:unnamed protein product [Mytilus coruscus]
MKHLLTCLIISVTVHDIDASLCTTANKEKVGRVVFGEASGESPKGQLEVAYTIVNRISHAGFPNSLDGVIDQTYTSGGKTYHHYNTLDDSGHDQRWKASKTPGAIEHAAYNSAITQAGHALCATKSDPMSCGPHSSPILHHLRTSLDIFKRLVMR